MTRETRTYTNGLTVHACGCVKRPYSTAVLSPCAVAGLTVFEHDIAFNRTLDARYTACPKHRARLELARQRKLLAG